MIINITYITKSYIYHKINIEVLIGFEPMNKSFADSPLKPLGYSTIWFIFIPILVLLVLILE